MSRHWRSRWWTVLLVASFVTPGVAGDAFYDRDVAALDLEAPLPAPPAQAWRQAELAAFLSPTVEIDGPGEGYVSGVVTQWTWSRTASFYLEGHVVVRAPEGQLVRGRLWVPEPDLSGMRSIGFTLRAEAASPDAREAYFRAKAEHFEGLLQRGLPGGAWFRHRARVARAELAEGDDDEELPATLAPGGQRWRADSLDGTYAVFSGGRALSENLQLDRVIEAETAGEPTVDVATIEGITTAEMDWSARLEEVGLKEDSLDPLAASIPGDQHALFFGSFEAMVATLDEASRFGTPLLRLFEPRSESAESKVRYERQLGLELSAIARLLGSTVVRSVAITGSDPYFRTGTDVAVLFEAKRPEVLLAYLRGRHAERAGAETRAVEGKSGDVEWAGVVSEDRAVSSYVATRNGIVIVTNSPGQVERFAAVTGGQMAPLASLPEYRYFRQVYGRDDPRESAFLMLSDATIRRWCSPRWRIMASRRTRAAAIMADLQATAVAQAAGLPADAREPAAYPFPGGHDIAVPEGVARSTTWGSLAFLRPIAEIPLDKVTAGEAEAYSGFRNLYQQRWRNFFDPIALRIRLEPERVELDLSVMPLIAGTDYGELIAMTRGATLAPRDGDPHPGALLHYAMAIRRDAEAFRMGAGMLSGAVPGLTDPLGWIGSHLSVFADADPFWDEMASAESSEAFLGKESHRLPVGLHVDVTDGLKLAAFLTGLKASAEQAAPGMLLWETRKHGEVPYVVIRPTEQARPALAGMGEWNFHYVARPRSFLLTLDESLLKRALDRAAGGEAAAEVDPWLGRQVALRAERGVLDLIEAAARPRIETHLQVRSWSNLPILNTWRRLYPEEDPVAVHERLWGVRLLCPGGGAYRWNEAAGTMESTVYGHPGAPVAGPVSPIDALGVERADFGLTFEDEGLRARVVLDRRRATQ